MKNLNTILKSVSMVAVVAVLTACGSQSTKNLALTSSNNSSGGSTNNYDSGSGNPNNDPAAPEYRVQLSGNGGGAFSKSFTTTTSKKLRIKVTALSGPNLVYPGYTSWVFAYGCMRVSVTVNGSTRMTKILKVAGSAKTGTECDNAPSSEIIDFSNVTTGAGKVAITFSNPEYDNCRYYDINEYGCSMKAVWMNHQMAFTTAIQPDGYYME